MTIHEYIMKAIQDDARRAGERDRLLLEARRARRARRQRLVPAVDEALAAGAFLLSRRSYEWLAARWPSRSGEALRLGIQPGAPQCEQLETESADSPVRKRRQQRVPIQPK